MLYTFIYSALSLFLFHWLFLLVLHHQNFKGRKKRFRRGKAPLCHPSKTPMLAKVMTYNSLNYAGILGSSLKLSTQYYNQNHITDSYRLLVQHNDTSGSYILYIAIYFLCHCCFLLNSQLQLKAILPGVDFKPHHTCFLSIILFCCLESNKISKYSNRYYNHEIS